jgi:conjugative transposon TraM protein
LLDAVLKQLETAMAAIQQNAASAQGDPELNMMNGMLDKVLDIQHPGRVKDRMDKNKTVASKGMRVAPVAAVNRVDTILSASRPVGDASPLSVTTRPATSNGFYELSQGSGDGQVIAPAISAVVHETQTLVTGSTLKIRLEQDVYVQNQRIPKGTFIYGRCAMSGERLQITFTAIRHGQLLFPVDLVAYALDGIPGVRIPGSMTRDAAKQGTNDALQAISMGSLNPSIEAQATAAGIDAAKTLLTRKVKLVRVTIKSDYPLLLKDGTTAQP